MKMNLYCARNRIGKHQILTQWKTDFDGTVLAHDV